MKGAEPNVQKPLLQYGDAVTGTGVTLEATPGGLTIRIPPRRLKGERAVAVVVAVGIAAMTLLAVLFLAMRQGSRGAVVAGFGAIGVLGATVGFLLRRPARWGLESVVELTATELRLTMHEGESGPFTVVRPRGAITEVRYNPYEKAMLVRAPGYELLPMLLINEDRRVIEWVAEQLRAAIGLEGDHD